MSNIERALPNIKYTAFGNVRVKGSNKMSSKEQSLSNGQWIQGENGFEEIQHIFNPI